MKKLLATMALSLGLLSSANASLYSLDYQGVGFTFETVDHNSAIFKITGALSAATGNWASATYLSSFAFKDLGFDPTGGTVSPGTFATSPFELNANGCAGGDSGGICFTSSPALALSDSMTFAIDFLGGTFDIEDTGPHLKVLFLNNNLNKQGSLLSMDMAMVSPPAPPPELIPEPSALVLLGAALVSLGFLRRKD